jgi:hypothetical protein
MKDNPMTINCYDCKQVFEVIESMVYKSADTIDRQYTVSAAVKCPFCNVENYLYRWIYGYQEVQ